MEEEAGWHAGKYTGFPEGQEAVEYVCVPSYVSIACAGPMSLHLDAAWWGRAYTQTVRVRAWQDLRSLPILLES